MCHTMVKNTCLLSSEHTSVSISHEGLTVCLNALQGKLGAPVCQETLRLKDKHRLEVKCTRTLKKPPLEQKTTINKNRWSRKNDCDGMFVILLKNLENPFLHLLRTNDKRKRNPAMENIEKKVLK